METGLSGRPAVASVAAALFLAASLMAIAEIAADPTSEEGVLTSTWTPLRGVWSLVGGADSFGGSWDLGSIAGGLALLLAVAVGLGLAGIVVIRFLLGPWPGPVAAMTIGAAWGLVVQILVVSLLLGGLLGAMPPYDSVPHWAWWLATGTWGAALGLLHAAPASAARRPEARAA